jgi:predicted DsbA family dithiol-disulfide isomerase
MKLKSSTVLTVNHVFDILCEWYQCRNWKQALDKVVPERKQDKEKAVEPEESKE